MYVRVSFRHRWGHDLKFVQNEEWTPQFSIAMWSVPRHFLCWVQHGEFSASSEQVNLGKYVASFNWYKKKRTLKRFFNARTLLNRTRESKKDSWRRTMAAEQVEMLLRQSFWCLAVWSCLHYAASVPGWLTRVVFAHWWRDSRWEKSQRSPCRYLQERDVM